MARTIGKDPCKEREIRWYSSWYKDKTAKMTSWGIIAKSLYLLDLDVLRIAPLYQILWN